MLTGVDLEVDVSKLLAGKPGDRPGSPLSNRGGGAHASEKRMQTAIKANRESNRAEDSGNEQSSIKSNPNAILNVQMGLGGDETDQEEDKDEFQPKILLNIDADS